MLWISLGKLPTYNFLSFNFGGSNDTLDGLEYEQDYEGDDADESSSDEGDLINSVKRFKFGLAQRCVVCSFSRK